jgi:hypothetical protein
VEVPDLRRLVVSLVAAIAATGACNQGGDGDFDFDDNTGASVTLTSAPTTTTPGTTGTETGSSGAEDPATTDVPSTTETGTGDTSGTDDSTGILPTEPCTTIDVLIVVDNSDAMAEEQARLNVALGPFFTLINEQLPGVMGSIHVAVITTDAPEFVITTPAGECSPYASTANWMSFGPTLSTELMCASAVGTMGDVDERPMQMAIEALSPALQGIDGFNEGFLRATGPLVLLVVTDEEDDYEAITEWGSQVDYDEDGEFTVADWVQALAATQDGYVQDVVPLVLVGPVEEPNACPDVWNGVDGAETATRLVELAESFPHHAIGDICDVEYTTFLNGAVPAIASACNEWVPE